MCAVLQLKSKFAANFVIEPPFNCNKSEITKTQIFPCEYLNKHQILCFVFLFFPFLFSPCCINQNPRTEDVLYSVCIPQPIATVIRLQSRVWLMDLLYLFFLSNITVCLLMLLVSFQGLYQLSWLQCGIQRVFKLAVNVVLGGQEKSIVAVWSSH